MRVAYICADPGVPVFGRKGCSIHVQEVVQALKAQGARVDIFAARFDEEPLYAMEKNCLHRLPTPSGRVHEQTIAANSEIAAMLMRAGPFDMVYERYSLWSFAAMEYARAVGIPGLLEVNAPLIEEQAEHRRLADRETAQWAAVRIFTAATLLIAVSDKVATYLGSYPITHGRVHVIPNGVNPGRFPAGATPTYPAPPGTFTVGFVGTLKPWHGLPMLIEAFDLFRRRNQNTRLLIVGDGPERERLTADILARGLSEACHLTGAVAPDTVPGLLASMDVAVTAYQEQSDFYFSPLKLYEYMAAGVPVVASRVGQLAELIRDGHNGLLCPPGDVAALVEALERLHRDDGLRTRIGRAGRATVIRNHTWNGVARRILELACAGPAAGLSPLEMKGHAGVKDLNALTV